MQSSEKLWEPAPGRTLADRPLERPGMYLIALRSYLNRGKASVGEILHDAAGDVPRPAGLDEES